MDEDLYTAMHAAADEAERKLQPYLTRAVLDASDCNALLQAAQEWLNQDDADVERLRRAIDEFNSR